MKMNSVAKETSSVGVKKKSKSVFNLYKGMVSTFFTGLKDLTTDSVPDPPRPLPVRNSDTENNLKSNDQTADKHNSLPESDTKSQESDSRNSTPTSQRPKTGFKTNSKQQKKSKKDNGFQSPPFNVRANRNYICINNSDNFHIGPSFEQKVIMSADTSSKVKIKKTPKIKAILLDNTLVDRDHLDIASTHLGHKWRALGRILKFSEGQMDQFEAQGRQHIKEVVYQMLLAWTQEYPEEATLSKLCSSLWEVDEREVVQKLAESVVIDD